MQAVTHRSQTPQRLQQAPTAEVVYALQAYRTATQVYHVTTRRPWPLLPPAPDLRVHHLWRKVEVTKRQWTALAVLAEGRTP